MDYCPSRFSNSSQQFSSSSSQSFDRMALLAMATPPPNSLFSQHTFETPHSMDYFKQRQSAGSPVALPSIRQAIPELQLTTASASSRLKHSSQSTPTGPPVSHDYAPSTSDGKRRRASNEEEHEDPRAKRVPRLYTSPEPLQAQRTHQLPLNQPPPSQRHHNDPSQSSSDSTETSWMADGKYFLAAPSPPPTVQRSGEVNGRLPHPPTSTPYSVATERNSQPVSPSTYVRQRLDEKDPSKFRGAPGLYQSPSMVKHQSYMGGSYTYPPAHSMPHEPKSPGRSRSYEQARFADASSSPFAAQYPDSSRYGGLGLLGVGNDARQRKRRGNLPKETTDKLRAWFVAHLQHPYPTEDEKQDLMRQTGLQMNQISNWFINARRRQLPAMINNARVETDAMNHANRGTPNGDSQISAISARGGLRGGDSGRSAASMSDDDAEIYGEETSSRHQQSGAVGYKRESI